MSEGGKEEQPIISKNSIADFKAAYENPSNWSPGHIELAIKDEAKARRGEIGNQLGLLRMKANAQTLEGSGEEWMELREIYKKALTVGDAAVIFEVQSAINKVDNYFSLEESYPGVG